MFQWLLTILISLNLAVSSVPRCGMIRHVVMALFDSQSQPTQVPTMPCHQIHDSAEKGSMPETHHFYWTDEIPCPCHLAKFSYIWVLFDLSTQPVVRLTATPMAMAWPAILSEYATQFTLEPPPPRATTALV